MTYLQLVNSVLRRLREDTVSTVTETAYSTMIGDMVNDAKMLVEDSWDWTALRSTLTVATTASDYNYSLTGSGTRAKILDAINDTDNRRLVRSTLGRFNQYFLLNTPADGSPAEFFARGTDSNGDLSIDIYPVPDGVYSLKFDITAMQADLSDGADVLSVPSKPVELMSYAMAARERGETGGDSAQELFSIANRYLSDAIQKDAGQFPGELVWSA